jgi:pantoate--beta-alanine ligase
MQKISTGHIKSGQMISFVPTMGYLHQGHASLIKEARNYGEIVVVSIFVNPVQFGPNEDFEKYPRDFDRDSKIAEASGADYIFYPEVREMYPDTYNTVINLSGATKKFEGASRPGHFSGVATVVAKLFNIVKPQFALFGQKDYQQTLVIKQMVKDLNFDVKIIIAPTIREKDGLAMSSRNSYLSPDDRADACLIFKSLEKAVEAIEAGERRRKIINAVALSSLRSNVKFKVDYCLSADADTLDEPEEFVPGHRIVLLVAAYLGKTRLIDNVVVSVPSAISGNPGGFVGGV